MKFKEWLLINEKITNLLPNEQEIKNWIINVYLKSNFNNFKKNWINGGGNQAIGLLGNNIKSLILPSNLTEKIGVKIHFLITNQEVKFGEINNNLIIFINPNENERNFLQGLDHEFNHLSNYITKRYQYGKDYNLKSKNNFKFVGYNGNSNDENLYFSHFGEIDAFAREYAELYKRDYPNQKFNLEKLKKLKTIDFALPKYISMLKSKNKKYFEIGKRFISKIAVEINKQNFIY